VADNPTTIAESRLPEQVYLAHNLNTALTATLRYCPVLAAEPEGRLSAIVDFTFNLGPGRLQTSTLRRRINYRDWVAAATELRRWVYGGGQVLPGLVTRREADAKLCRLCVRGNRQLRIIAMRPMATTTPMTPEAATAPHVPSFGLSQ